MDDFQMILFDCYNKLEQFRSAAAVSETSICHWSGWSKGQSSKDEIEDGSFPPGALNK